MNIIGETDSVLIIGASPAGLLLAAQLLRFGIHPVIIDSKSSSSKVSPSILLQPRTFEIFNQLGLAKELLHASLECDGLTIQVEREVINYISYAQWVLDSGSASLLNIEQRKIEELLINYLAVKACPIYWNSQLTAFNQDSSTVKIELNKDGEIINRIFKWLIVAEKEQFDIKENLGISYKHWASKHPIYQLVLRTDELHNRNQHLFLKKNSFAFATPINDSGSYDFVGTLPQSSPSEMAFKDIKDALDQTMGFSIPVVSDEWHRTDVLQSFLANESYKQRSLLIGNAVFKQSGFVGYEINSGLQDAYNIGWKLANVCLDKQEESMLSSYEEERKKISDARFKKDRWLFKLFKGSSVLSYDRRKYLIKKLLQKSDWYDVDSNYQKSNLSVHHSRGRKIKAGDKLPFINVYDEKKQEETDLFQWCKRPGFVLLVLGNLSNNSLFILAQWMKQKYTRYMQLFYLPYSSKNQAVFDAFEVKKDQNKMILVRPDMYIAYIHDVVNTGLIDTYMIGVMRWKF
ncbi:FAD-dependent monooxygenase [Albibacterium sp.]|uniref:FAD-dependent monooxygenase n=1 Tax=Albibacterium sp. TaxID=2952885 RepID=UPI002C958E9E|nr:FAD-dependent monooxygenase [Albibacterium sp.]HUH20006.1 FAD-dependent monooxygenase [Albibacterium sp.]